MTINETKKYRILKYIVIGLLMTVELFLFYLIIMVLKNQNYSIDLIILSYGFITIPVFLAISFPNTEISDPLIKFKYFGLLIIQRNIDELSFSLTDKGDGFKIENKFGQKLLTVYQENTSNFNDIIVYLEKRINKGGSSKTSKARWTYTLWIITGLILVLVSLLTK